MATRWCCDKDATSDSPINVVIGRKKNVESVNEVWMGGKQVRDPLDDAWSVDSKNRVREGQLNTEGSTDDCFLKSFIISKKRL